MTHTHSNSVSASKSSQFTPGKWHMMRLDWIYIKVWPLLQQEEKAQAWPTQLILFSLFLLILHLPHTRPKTSIKTRIPAHLIWYTCDLSRTAHTHRGIIYKQYRTNLYKLEARQSKKLQFIFYLVFFLKGHPSSNSLCLSLSLLLLIVVLLLPRAQEC